MNIHMLKVNEVKINYLKEPMGITDSPQFSWILDSDKKNVVQRAYRLQISTMQSFDALVYDSQKVDNEESAHVFADGFLPESATKYFVRVKVLDNHGEETAYSEPAAFLSGLISNDEWKASFISAESKENTNHSKGTYLRKELTISKKLKQATAYTTALGLYHFYINGEKVGEDQMAPGWTSYENRLLYQTHDITSCLKEGDNALGAHIGAGWYKGAMGFQRKQSIYGKQAGFLCQIHLQYEDGSNEIVISDDSWLGCESPVVFSEIYDGEIYDANLEQNGWNLPGFNDSHWQRSEALLVDHKILVAQPGCKVKKIESLPVQKIFKTPQGDTVIDFGQNLTGWISFKVNGKSGEKVILNCFEVLDKDGNVYLDNLRTAKETLEYICNGDGKTIYEPNFTFQGFRYAKVASYPGELLAENFTAYVVHSDMEETGTFSCSNPDLNQLQHNITWGLKGNFLDVPTDCPQRDERLGWTGDAQIFCRTASYIMDTYTFFSKWLKDLSADQTPEGGVPHVIPDILNGVIDPDPHMAQEAHSATAWADAAVINPWTLYLVYGDKKIIHNQYQSMKAWIDFMTDHSVDGIWSYKQQFGDWVALDAEKGSYLGATPNELICTAYYAYSSGLFAKMAKAIGMDEDYQTYWQLHKDIVYVFKKNFFTEDGLMTAQTQTAHIVALYFDLVPEKYKEQTAKSLVALLEKENGHLVTGFVGTPYFCHALSENGYTKEAYDLLLKDDFPSWLYQIRKGATTIWEHWDGIKEDGSMWSADMNSFNHYAYGAIGDWLYRVVVGIEADEQEPGYKHFMISPHIGGGLAYAKGTFKSVYGEISVHWQRDGKTIQLEFTVPVNTTATLVLPEIDQIITDDGIKFIKNEDGYEGVVGSGDYLVTYTIL